MHETIELGGITRPNIYTENIYSSAQQMRVEPNSNREIAVFCIQKNEVVIINKVTIQFFTWQAKQDVWIEVFVGNDYFRTGKYQTEKFKLEYGKEVRTVSSANTYSGGLLTTASTTSAVFPDNFGVHDKCFFSGTNNEKIKYKITNQSSYFAHVVMINLSGWQVKGESGHKIVESIKEYYGKH